MNLRPALLLLFLAACSSPPREAAMSPGAPPAAAAPAHVVLISVDGLAAYYLDDPKAHLPTIRRLAREGAVAAGVRSSFPTVTWPNHTTLVTGVAPAKHGVIANSYLDRSTGKTVMLLPDPVFDKDEIVKVPTVYDLAHDAGMKTAGVIWPASRNAKSLDWTMPDVKPIDLFLKCSTPAWLDELRAAGIWVDMQEKWCNAAGGGVQRDWMYARAAAQVIREHQPRLVLLHLVEADHAQHNSGPRSSDAYWACSHEDDRVRDVVEAVEAAGLRDRTTFFVVSDHGFIAYRRTILPNVHLRKSGLLKLENDKVVSRDAYSLAQGGAAFVYVLDKSRRSTTLQNLKAKFKGHDGVAAVFEDREFPELGLPTPDADPRMPDLILAAKDGYTFGDDAKGDNIITSIPAEKGTHGTLATDPLMYGTFIASGAGIRPGTKLDLINGVDVAPTIARLLGLRMPNVDGRVLDEILR
jgi:predicted AlkP superfamily pyrophosphatase or phosphodiesterase